MESSYRVGLVLEHFQRKWSRTANSITTGVNSDIDELKALSTALKWKVESDTAHKEDIAILEERVNELIGSATDELKRKVEGHTASKEDIAMLEQKIRELKTAQDAPDTQSKNSGNLRPAPRNYHLGREIAKNGISPNLARMMPLGH